MFWFPALLSAFLLCPFQGITLLISSLASRHGVFLLGLLLPFLIVAYLYERGKMSWLGKNGLHS